MNATQWETLTDFVKWLGREGKCVVDETEKGWFVAYIDRDPATIAALEAKAKKEKLDKDDQVIFIVFTCKNKNKLLKRLPLTISLLFLVYIRLSSFSHVPLYLVQSSIDLVDTNYFSCYDDL